MNKKILRAGWHVLDMPKAFRQECSSMLRAINPTWAQAKQHSPSGYVADSIPQYLYFFDHDWAINESWLARGFPLHRLSPEFQYYFNHLKVVDERTGKRIKEVPSLLPKYKLNSEQRSAIKAMDVADRPAGNLLFLASTSVGKTLLQAAASFKLGYKVLVLCPTDLVLEAWYNDLKKFYGLNRDDIGLIKQSKWTYGAAITLGSFRTIDRRRDRWDELNQKFGTLVVDEVQKIAAPTVSAYVRQYTGKYVIGATATQHKNGTPIAEITYYFGKPIIHIDTSHKETTTSLPISKVRQVRTTFSYDVPDTGLDWHDLSNHMMADEDRNVTICNEVYNDWRRGRTILVVTKFHEHIEMLVEMLGERGVTDVNRLTGNTNSNKAYTRQLIRSINRRDSRCTVATLSAIAVGANIRAFDCLHVAIPPVSTDLTEQLLGRLRRKHDEEKKTAEVVWYLDVNVGYLRDRVFHKQACSVFTKMKVPGYENTKS